MKIVEIISENVDEGILSGAARLAARALGGTRLGRAGRIDDAARRFINRGNTHTSDAQLLHDFPGENLDDIRREIERRASGRFGRQIRRAQRNRQMNRDIEFIRNTFSGALTTIRNTINLVALGELGYILFTPFKEYYDRMITAEEWLNAEDPAKRWSQEQYDAFHRQELVSLVDKIARIYIANKVLRIVPNIGRLLGQNVGNAITTLARPARYWLANEMATHPELANAFSITMINHLFPTVNGEPLPVVENVIGKKLADAENTIFDAVKQAQGLPGQPATTGQGGQPATQPATTGQAPSASQPAKKKKPTLDELKPIKPEDWELSGADWLKHVPSNQVFPRHLVVGP